MNKHIGSDFEDYLREDGLLEEIDSKLKIVCMCEIKESIKCQIGIVLAFYTLVCMVYSYFFT